MQDILTSTALDNSAWSVIQYKNDGVLGWLNVFFWKDGRWAMFDSHTTTQPLNDEYLDEVINIISALIEQSNGNAVTSE